MTQRILLTSAALAMARRGEPKTITGAARCNTDDRIVKQMTPVH
jgi:hypothetical protein